MSLESSGAPEPAVSGRTNDSSPELRQELTRVVAPRYQVGEEIGRGGMAFVYGGWDTQERRAVAFKVLKREYALLGSSRFLREIRLLTQLHHPGILPLLDSGHTDSLFYFVMPLADGETLQARLDRELQLPLDTVTDVVSQVAVALEYAHEAGVIHRDIKPSNLFLTGDRVLVADFGVAKDHKPPENETTTSTGLVLGTVLYMSPEQADGNLQPDRRSDVYSLGCVAYQMLVGEPPFTGNSSQAVVARHRSMPVPSVRLVRPDLPAGVDGVIRKALAKSPADRYQRASDFANALSDPARLAAAASDVEGERPRTRRWLIGGGIALAGAALALFFARRAIIGGEPPTAQPASVLVADFKGPAADRNLSAAVRELVSAELDQSRVITTLPRQQIGAALENAGLADTSPLNDAVARELAVRSSVRAILGGSVLPVGQGRYSIVVRVIEPDSGRSLLTVSGAASDQDLIPTVQRLAQQVRKGLGEQWSSIRANKLLVQVATPSFAAYRKYVEAVELSQKGELTAGNRLLHEAIALDTGFASAWATAGMNYLTSRNLDSAGVAMAEALRRPDRLSDAQRYRLEAEAAYALRYDIPAAVRWYDLLLEVAPRNINAHNDRGVYLYSLGRYDEALADYTVAAALEPFGPADAQIEFFNQTTTLLALGRERDAVRSAERLTGVFADYAAPLVATYQARWTKAESLATWLTGSPGTPQWVKNPATTMLGGALAARGSVTAADQRLRAAAAGLEGSSRRGFYHAALLLTAASGRPLAQPPAWLSADSSAGGLFLAGVWAAMAGDTATAEMRLRALERQPPVELRRLGHGVPFLRASIAAAQNHWPEVVNLLGPAAAAGELDAGTPDQVSSMALRWLVAKAYDRMGRADSAAAYFELVSAPTSTPFSHIALRGLAWPFAERNLALLYRKLQQPERSRQHWNSFVHSFVTPDPSLKSLTLATSLADQ